MAPRGRVGEASGSAVVARAARHTGGRAARLLATDHDAVRRMLDDRRREHAGDPAVASPAAWNLGRERANAALATLP